MRQLRPLSLELSSLVGLVRDRRGVGAVEFALVLPVLLLLYIGCFDVSEKIMATDKAAYASETVAELVAEQTTTTAMTNTQLSAIMTAATATMAPFPTAQLKVTISAIDLTVRANKTCCDATVRWSYTQGGTLRPCKVILTQGANSAAPTPTTIPASIGTPPALLVLAGTQPTALIISDISYTYSPVSPAIVPTLTSPILRTMYTYPRTLGQVTLATPLAPPSGQSGAVCS